MSLANSSLLICCIEPQAQGTLQSAPTPPVGSQYSCQPTVKLHILPLVWIFPLGKGSTGAQEAAAGICLEAMQQIGAGLCLEAMQI